jgi:ankyrin repeat protein
MPPSANFHGSASPRGSNAGLGAAHNIIWMYAFKGDVERLANALQSATPASINKPFTRQWTPLYAAASKGNMEAVRLLLEAGADVSVPTEKLWTPLMAAAAAGKIGIAKMLLDFGSDPAGKNDQGLNSLSLARSAKADVCAQFLEGAPYLFSAYKKLVEMNKGSPNGQVAS